MDNLSEEIEKADSLVALEGMNLKSIMANN
jgi:hypothetical protein